MKILQFVCVPDPPATQLKQLILAQANTWSRLQRLSQDANYITEPFGMDMWKEHTNTEGLHWLDYNALYDHLGDDGRLIADQMFGDGAMQGILKNAPLVNALPNSKIQIIEVEDLVAEGYLPEPVTEEGL